MTTRNELHILRTCAKHLARAARIPHHQALNIVATQCEHPHWKALMSSWEKGWRPTVEQLAVVKKPSASDASPRDVGSVSTREGVIAGEPYRLDIYFADVLIGGRGWAIHLGHASSQPAAIEKYRSPNPLDDDVFFSEVMKVANKAADEVREAIAQDWPRRSTKPDKDGRAAHPLFGGLSSKWYCMHCDTRSSGAEVAANMWHCPQCGAAPIDIHMHAWWKEALPSE